MKKKNFVRVNHFAAKTLDAVAGSNKEGLIGTLLVLIFSGAMMYAGYGTHSLLFVMSGVVFIASALILILELCAIIKSPFSKNE